ncbi:hypothetical protein [Chryseobacterium sp. PMSZPI]|uniref:hypothetical protein n=1 Tax=Chryseobacterium sp. PMSZPI TaxID=1033900 RepID=UPI000C34F6AA|nr:hypothetical protein [Chryseobacterium sp. PMSZPI]PKF73957.1 hypothetical protein CW752_11905 [Chryseobacterium sp. PMSZPI]
MKKCIWALSLMSLSLFHAQTGINTTTPNSTLTVNGSFEADYKEITSSAYNITSNDYYLTYNGASNATFTLPSIGTGNLSFSGRIYRIKNISGSNLSIQASNGNTLRSDNAPVSTFVVAAGAYAEIVNNNNTNGGTWDLTYTPAISKFNNAELYVTQLLIPPHSTNNAADWTNHANTGYDTGTGSDAWWVISKASSPYTHTATTSSPSRMTIVYEYQGLPFNISKMYPLLTAGNNSSFPDVYSASFVGLANNGTGGKTRLTISVARIDFIGGTGSGSSDWGGVFLLNTILAKKMN